MMINTEVPTLFENVVITRNGNDIYVKTKDVAKIAFYNQFTNEIYCVKGTYAHYSDKNSDFTSVCISGHNKIPYIDIKKYLDLVYLQNDISFGNGDIKADKIRIGSKVTMDIPEGEYIFKDGRMNLSAKEITLEFGTTVEKGAELYISTDKQ